MRLLWWLATLGSCLPSAALAQARLIHVDPDPDRHVPDVRPPSAYLIDGLLRRGMLRRASATEVARVRAGIVRHRGDLSRLFDDRFYVLLKPVAASVLDELSGGRATNFIVPPMIGQRRFGYSHSNFFTPAGKCLHGGACPPCRPGDLATGSLDPTAAGCLPGLPWVPPAPPAPPALPAPPAPSRR